MRLIAFLCLVTLTYASEFPDIFSSAGDEVYVNMQRYQKIKELDIYKNRPELLEAYCIDANASMQKGFTLDKIKDDPELDLDKQMIKSYAKELRVLSQQNDQIISELDKDIQGLYKQGDFKTLKKISDAGFMLSKKIMHGIKENEIKEKSAKTEEKPKTDTGAKKKKEILLPLAIPTPVPAEVKPAQKPSLPEVKPSIAVEEKEQAPAPVKKKPTKLEYYKMSLSSLKDELYALRENMQTDNAQLPGEYASADEAKMECLNDITAINYWMIKVLESHNDVCALRDAIKQMKSYDKAAMKSCGRESLRYTEWHGRIKPYVGKRLFEAEAGCTQ